MKSLKKIILFLYLFIIGNAQAQELESSLLWKITHEHRDSPSYLFGTIHATCEIKFNENINKALQETEQLFLEIDMSDPEMQTKLMKNASMKDSKTISKMLDPKELENFNLFLQKQTGFTLQMIDGLKPFIITSMLIPKIIECPMISVESFLMQITKKDAKQVFGLETVEDQLAMFDLIPYDFQINELLKMSKDDLKESKEEYRQMKKMYDHENIQKLYDYVLTSSNQMMKKYQDVLLDKRNQKWIPIIKKVSAEKPTFFAVGAAHLAGESGVINLLRKAGFKVEAVLP